MSVFVDTSAIVTYLDADDPNHAVARRIWTDLLARKENLVSSSYVVSEAFAVVQRRLGFAAVTTLHEQIYPVMAVEWVDEATHEAGVVAVLAAGRRSLSLVDCVSFLVMRTLEIREAFCFDPHFREAGFQVLP